MNNKTVNINNYESFIIDYFDGKLSDNEQQDLFDFLKTHPKMMADFVLFKESQDIFIQSDTTFFPNPEKLKKNIIIPVDEINETNYQEHFIAFYENDLDKLSRLTLSIFLEKNSSLSSEFESFKKLRLVPDKNIVFKDIQRLKHTSSRFTSIIWTTVASVAAVLLLLFLFRPGADMPSSPITPEQIIVQTDNNEPEVLSDTTNIPFSPVESIVSEQKSNPRPSPTPSIAHTENIITSKKETDENYSHETLYTELNTETTLSDFSEIITLLEPDVVLIKTISESEPTATDSLLAFYKERQQGKRALWKILSWGVKQYNTITNDNVAIMKVENLTTNETVYYLCRGEN